MLILASRMVGTDHIHRPVIHLVSHTLQIILAVPQQRCTDVLRALPVSTRLISWCRFRKLGREEVEIVRAGLSMDGEQVGLGFAGVVQCETRGHVDEEDGGGCQGCERDGAVRGFGFGDLGA